MSCDNVEDNGGVAREAFSAFAGRARRRSGSWVREEVCFPSSMVDRITPATSQAHQAEVAAETGLLDRAAVVCEPYAQWVLEDSFSLGRPPFERVGVQVVADVRPYELMKLRLLNASHQVMAYVGLLSGYRWVHDAAADPSVRALMAAWMAREARPTLPDVPGIDLDEYCATLLQRFANPALGDTLTRLAAFSSDRIPPWVLPVVRENLQAGGSVEVGAAVVASWARYLEGTDEQGEALVPVDQLAEVLTPLAKDPDPDAFLSYRPVFGDLADAPRFHEAYLWARRSFSTSGAQATTAELLARLGSSPPA
jgi:mannitol 2-dehydrogenase